MEVHHAAASTPTAALSAMADALPGLGIVAAVLGVVLTMSSLGGPPEEIGHKVAAALVGTFLGILSVLRNGRPTGIEDVQTELRRNTPYYHVLRVVISPIIKGMSPLLAIEMGRRAIPDHVRPSFQEVEKACRQKDESVTSVAA